jgi:WD40 repeat protein/serine/threonine protein kinase
MDDARWDLTKKLFADALALPHGERAAFLDRECAGDAILKFEVESLLEARTVSLAKLGVQTGGGARAALAELTTGEQHPISEVAGTIIGPYKLLQPIGEGGFGTVFMAEQERPVRRRVALKIIKMGMDTKQVIARFEQERQALALMDHPHIAKVLDAGATETGRPFFVMELVKGEEITRYCDRNQLGIRERFDLFQQVCAAVQHAHTKGIIHRDIKPSNVLVSTQDGQPFAKVIDFGIAKATDHRLTEKTLFTDHHAMIGTPAYMSPEQAEGSIDIDTRTDVYSLGILLYELLVGSTPFDSARLRSAAYAELQRLIREVEPPSPSGRLSELTTQPKDAAGGTGAKTSSIQVIASQRKTDPSALQRAIRGELDWMVMKALRKDRARRYASAESLAADVQRYLDGMPLEAGPESTAYRLRKLLRRHRGPAIAIAAVSVAILLGLAGTITQAQRASRKADDEAAARKVADARAAEIQKKSDEIEYNSYVANVQMAGASMDMRLFDQVRQRLDACPEHLRGWEWGWLNAAADTSLFELKGHTSGVKFAGFSPDGSRIITASNDSTVRVWDATTGASLTELKEDRRYITSGSFSQDGSRIVTVSDDPASTLSNHFSQVYGKSTSSIVRVWDAGTGTSLGELKDQTRQVLSASFSPDGTRIVAVSDVGARVWDAWAGALLTEFKGHGRDVCVGVLSPDGTRVLTASDDTTARVWDAKTGEPLSELMGLASVVRSAKFSPDGTRIVTVLSDRSARVWDTANGISLAELNGDEVHITSAAFSPDGTRIVSASFYTARIWDATTGASLGELKGHKSELTYAVFSPNGSRIVTASKDGTARLWDATNGAIVAELRGHTSEVNSAEFSPDGTRIVTASRDGTARVWDVGVEASAFELRQGPQLARGLVAFSPDGKHIVTSTNATAARVWDATNGVGLAELKRHDGPVRSLAFSPDGTRVVTASYDKTARVWDAKTGSSLIELKGHTSAVNSAVFSSDGTRIVTASTDGVGVWDGRSGTRLFQLARTTSLGRISASMSPDGTRVITSSPTDVNVIDAATGSVLAQVGGFSAPNTSATFSPDSSRIIIASGNAVGVWNADLTLCLVVLQGHTEQVNSAAFSPDGTRVLTASSDITARVWDTKTGAVLAVLRGHSAAVLSAEFVSHGTRIVTASSDGIVRVWDSVPYRERSPAIQKARQQP